MSTQSPLPPPLHGQGIKRKLFWVNNFHHSEEEKKKKNEATQKALPPHLGKRQSAYILFFPPDCFPAKVRVQLSYRIPPSSVVVVMLAAM